MENIKQKLSEVAHSWTAIGMITLFLFGVQPEVVTVANALVSEVPAQYLVMTPKEEKLQAQQLKKETLEKFSNTVYRPSDLLSDKQLKDLLKAVGFEGKALKMAWAVAKSESNGRPMAYNGNRSTGDSSYGIFQINMLGKLGVDRKEKFELRSNILLFDPVINAEITYYMTRGGSDWSSWTSARSGAVNKWLSEFPNQ